MPSSVFLVNPPYIRVVYGLKKASAVKPPLGLAYVAASLEHNGFKVEILDANAEFLNIQETVERILRSNVKYIGFTAVSATMSLVFQISELVKAKNAEKFIFVGGPHATFTAVSTLKDCLAIDAVIQGEGEITVCELIEALENGKNLSEIAGLAFRKKQGEIIENSPRSLIENINFIPVPARHLLSLELYSPSAILNMGFKGKKYATVITARGCPNRCVFCSSAAFWKIVRIRTPENVVGELEFLIEKYGVKHIDFLDDTLVLSKKRIEDICALMLQKNLNLKWTCYARVNHITSEIVALMKKAGCEFIQFGVESGSQKILNRIKKNINLDEVRQAVKIVKKAGVKSMCDFMVGLPEDTKETIQQTIDFAKELSPNFAFFSITTPFPGTELYNEYLKAGILKPGFIWDNVSLHEKTGFFTPTLTSQQLQNLYFKAHHSFYYRPAFIWQTFVWLLRHPKDLKNFIVLVSMQIFRELRNIFNKG